MASSLRGLVRWLLEKRYHVLARLFGVSLENHGHTSPGSVIIQVDALGYQNLLAVLEQGYMPNLKALLDSKSHTLRRWRCGLPSDTPPVQAGMMYGYNQDLVGFYWMDKSTGRRLNCANPLHAKLLEEHIAARSRPGVLSQGSCYATIISGNAKKAVFTVSRLDSYRLQNAFGLLGAFLFVLFKPPIFFTTAAHFTWDLVQEMADYVAARVGRRLRRAEGIFPITRAIINIVFREVATAGAIMDMFCGLPVIYVSYLGYDTVGHHSGPLSKNAMRTLRGIDRAIGKIRGTREWCRRAYDLYILSDHGMVPSVPFDITYGQPLSSYIASVVGDGVAVEEYDADRYLGRDQLSPLNQDLQEIERHLPRGLAALFRRTRTLLYRGDGYHTPMESGRISVIDCSPIAHIYVHDLPRRLDISEVEELYPTLVPALVSHPGVGLLMGIEDNQVVVFSRDGRTVLGRNPSTEGIHPLLQFEEPDLVLEEVRRLALTPMSGDLILFGAFQEGRAICFQSQLGAHGSLGGDQYYPFFIHPSGLDISLENVTTAADMYPVLRRIAGMGTEGGAAAELAPEADPSGVA